MIAENRLSDILQCPGAAPRTCLETFRQLLREGLNEKKTFSFGHCPNEGGGSTHARMFWPLTWLGRKGKLWKSTQSSRVERDSVNWTLWIWQNIIKDHRPFCKSKTIMDGVAPHLKLFKLLRLPRLLTVLTLQNCLNCLYFLHCFHSMPTWSERLKNIAHCGLRSFILRCN